MAFSREESPSSDQLMRERWGWGGGWYNLKQKKECNKKTKEKNNNILHIKNVA